MIARFLKDLSEIKRRALCRSLRHRPECKYKGLACKPDPFLSEIPGEILRAIYLERRISNQQRRIVLRQHCLKIRRSRVKLRFSLPLFNEQISHQGNGSER